KQGTDIFITGECDWEGLKVIEFEADQEADNLINMGRIVPLYNATEQINNKFLRSLVKQSLESALDYIEEFMPNDIISLNNLEDYKRALSNIHFPLNWEHKNKAYKRLVFNEFFLLILALLRGRQDYTKEKKSHSYILKKNLLTAFREKLKFEFTKDQKKAINEIFSDLLNPYPMNRLLQGDVGSGKTVVALSAMLLAVENKYQSAIMVPTEVLAQQHFLSLKNFTKGLNVRISLLLGSMKNKEKNEVYKQLDNGEIDIIIGTHALLEEKLRLQRVRLVVIDEQHRFGVHQRLALRTKSENIDVLVMTATPIPRTLALTLYGDLDISSIKQLPKGRKEIYTKITSQAHAFDFLKQKVLEGTQGYIVYPAVDENNKLELKAAVSMFEHLKNSIFKDINIGLLHGRMKMEEKSEVFRAFTKGDIKVIVATTVIEVGIDVPNASVMIIEHAERFGLSTLHQLRGRVGRGSHESYCFLISQMKTDQAKRRLKALIAYRDGFKLSEEDLSLRGPGDFLGQEQHGFLDLYIGSLVNDGEIIEQARKQAEEILEQDKFLSKYENIRLKKEIEERFKEKMELVKVG
ncbi:ATP-dependent DNA helicase RecG, partial [bacterium]